MKTEEQIEEMSPEEYVAYKKGEYYSSIASSISWISLVITLVGCATCHHLNS